MAAQFDPNKLSPAQLTKEEMLQELARVLNSKYFVHAPMKQKFLRLISEFYLNGRGGELNEYLIGREVFDRDDSYNPATDPIVRVGAHGVREKLALYYQQEGANNGIRIEIPIGSYEPVFTRTIIPEKANVVIPPMAPGIIDIKTSDSGALDQSVRRGRAGAEKKWLLILAAVTGLLAIGVGVLLVMNRDLKMQIQKGALNSITFRSSYGYVWEPFLKNSEPTLLILSNPVAHRAVNPADPDVLTRQAITLSKEQASVLTNAAGNRLPLKPDQPLQIIPTSTMFTGIGEAVGIYRVSGLLQAAGEGTILKQSRSVSPEDLKAYDVIMLGSVYANQWSKPLSVKENFTYTTRSSIENLDPRPGEEREYKSVFNQQTGSLIEDYALITVTPGVSGERTVMVLAGIYSEGTEAAADYVTDTNNLKEINQRLQQLGGGSTPPKYYQALLKVRVENSFPTKASLLTIRQLQETGQ